MQTQRKPPAAASRAALSPAGPAPITITSHRVAIVRR